MFSALTMFRALVFPWNRLKDPLISYEVHKHLRAGRRPYSMLVLGILTMLTLNLYLWYGVENDKILDDMLAEVMALLGFGFILMTTLGHWRVMMAIFSRAAKMIAQRRQRGDWDLIAIAPVPKSRWFMAQLTIMGWQVFPLLRQLLVVHGVAVLIGWGFLVYVQHEEWEAEQIRDEQCEILGECFYASESNYLHPSIYGLIIAPVGILFIVEPFFAMGIFALVSLYCSSQSKRTTMSILYSFVGVYTARLVMTFVLTYGGFLITLIFLLIADVLGVIDSGPNLNELDALGGAALYCCVFSLGLAFFLDWFPITGAALFVTSNEPGEFATLFVIMLVVFTLVYIFMPLLIMRFLGRFTVAQLARRVR